MITGATDGLGRALARKYAAAGKRLLLIGRRSLSTLTDPVMNAQTYCRADLSQPEAAELIASWLEAQQITRLDLLIHNAGTGYYGGLSAQTRDDINNILQVNLQTPIQLTYKLAPLLRASRGQVVFVSSTATAVPTPSYAVYSASKAALEGFARSLHLEWQGQVKVQIISPGAIQTGLHAKIGLTRQEMDWNKFPPAEVVAEQMLGAIARHRRASSLGLKNKLLRFAGRIGRPFLDPLLKKPETIQVTSATPGKETRAPLCVITGAADGIGRALAHRYAQSGYRILGVDIDPSRAEATMSSLAALGAQSHFIIADLSRNEGRGELLAGLETTGPCACFVHNAGINAVGEFSSVPLPEQEAVLALNLHAPLEITARLISRNLLLPEASLVFLSSLSYFLSYPGAAVYAASKDGLANYARSLRAAWPGTVLTVFPGPTRTAHARRYSPDNSREGQRMPPDKLAELIYSAERRGQARLIPGAANRIMAIGGTIAPSLLEWGMKKAILEKLAAD